MGKKVWAGIILVAAIAIVCVSAAVLLQNGNDDDNDEPVLAELEYEHNTENMTAEVHGIKNRDSATRLVIPEKFQYGHMELRVTSIADDLFRTCERLTGDLIIPNSVESIGKNAFYACRGFDGKLILGNGLRTIGENGFNGCGFKELVFDCGNLHSDPSTIFENCKFNTITVLKNGFVLGGMTKDTVREIRIAPGVIDTGELTSGWHFYNGTGELPSKALPGYTYVLDGDKMVRHGEFNQSEATA